MNAHSPCDEDLIRRLPLPVAHLYRRAHNAKSSPERHHAAYYLWEAALKLLSSVAVVEFAELDDHDPELAERLQNLARPSLGHWWEFIRRLVPVIAQRGDPGFAAARELLLGSTRDDLPHAAGLDAVLLQELEARATTEAKMTVRLTELFDRLLRYRNREIGHGAMGQRPAAFYDRLGRALLAGVPEVLGRLDLLAGRRLLYVADVRRHASGRWSVERYELRGESPRRLELLDLPDGPVVRQLLPERLYLEPAAFNPASARNDDRAPASSPESDGPALVDKGMRLVSLHPLVIYDADTSEVMFLNSRRGRQRLEYLSYSSGREAERTNLAVDQQALLSRVLHASVDGAKIADWAAHSQAEEQPVAIDEAPAAPRRLGEFELLSELGRGGMGVVYRAWQPSLGRQVAVKCLYRTGDPKAEARFAREIRALGHVEHPHLVKIFTSGNDGEQWFYAMELIEGATLAAVCERLQSASSAPETIDFGIWQRTVSTVCSEARRAERPLSNHSESEGPLPVAADSPAPAGQGPVRVGKTFVRQVVDLVRQTADAAHALHERGILHRDIKPGNIMLTPGGHQAVLMDLGLAQIADEMHGRLTKTRQFVGTLRYASPEQVLAVGGLDRRSDVYSLGATLWELLTFRPMFNATDDTPTPALMSRIQIEEPERPRKYHPRLARDLEAIVLKCLEKNVHRRYPTAHALARDLERYERGEPVHARPVSSLQRGWRWCCRNRTVASMLALLVLVIVGSLVGLSALYLNADRERNFADAARVESQRNLITSQFLLAESEVQQGRLASGIFSYWQAYHDARTVAGDPRGLNARDRIAFWSARLGQPLVHDGAVFAVAISPDGKSLLTGSWDGTARFWDAHSGQPRGGPLRHRASVLAVAYSPDGNLVATGSENGLAQLWDSATGEPRGQPLKHREDVLALAFSPDGKLLATTSYDDKARLWNVRTAQLQGAPLEHADDVLAIAFSPDGRTVLTGSRDKTAHSWAVDTGQPQGEPLEHEAGIIAVAFSPDGQSIVTGSYDKTAQLWNARTGQRQGPPLQHAGAVYAVAFLPDSQSVVTGSADNTARIWLTRTGRESGEPLRHEAGVLAVALSRDGELLLTGSYDRTARLWRLPPSERREEVLDHPDRVYAVAFSHDGQRVATGCGDKRARLWNARTGQPAGEPLQHDDEVDAVAFSPDDRLLVTGCWDGSARVWGVGTGQLEGQRLQHDGPVGAVAFSPDGKLILTGSRDCTARLWDATTGEPHGVILRHQGEVDAVAFSPDGKTIFTGSRDRTARIWDAESGLPRGEPLGHDDQVRAVACSPDGQTLLTGCADKLARFWNIRTGMLKGPPLRHEDSVDAVAFSPDGRLVATGCRDKAARLWDASGGAPRGEPLRHADQVRSVAFSPDGHSVVTGSADETAPLWDLFPPATDAAERLRLSVEVRTAYSLDDDGNRRFLSQDTWLDRYVRLAELGGPCDVPSWERNGQSSDSRVKSPMPPPKAKP